MGSLGKMGNLARLGFVCSFLFAGRWLEAYSAPKPFISRAIPDAAREILFIHGANFGKDPFVWLDGIRLQVLLSTPTLVQAELPSVDPGTYLLILLRGGKLPGADDIAAMDVTLGAVGPEGPPGPEGPEGRPGEAGEPGPPGRNGSTWFAGDGAPPPSLGDPGDFYLDQTSGDVHRKSTDWALVASLLGPQGLPGPPGPASDPREEVAALLGIDVSRLRVPLEAVTPAQCGSGASLALTTGSGSPGKVVGLFGEESISSPFFFRVALRSSGGGDPSSFVGGEAQILMRNQSLSMVSGIVTASENGGTIEGDSLYVLTIEPTLARARSFRGFATFERQSPSDIIAHVLQPFGISISVNLLGGADALAYEAQWNESSLDFVSRLMEREGIHFHFLDDGRMIVGDDNVVFGAGPSLPYLGHFADPDTAETVSSFRSGSALSPGRVTVRGWDYVSKQDVEGNAPSAGVGDVFTYSVDAVNREIAEHRAETLLEREQAEAQTGTGTSNSPGIRSGKRVAIGGAGSPFNGSYVVTKVQHIAYPEDDCFSYGNAFAAIRADVPFQPEAQTPVPRFPGTVSALVTRVEPTGLYRVKVRFPWLPSTESNWARVAVPAVFGAFVLPEVDDEVLVAFEHGDVRFPVVIGSLWNGVDKPPTNP